MGPEISEPATGSPTQLDFTRPHPGRVFDYWLGGKDHFPPDRELAERILAFYPAIESVARENCAFRRRVVCFLVSFAGVNQFLDVGAGLPTSQTVHEIAQELDPRARVVYADHDPMVLNHCRVPLAGTRQGAAACCLGDLRDPVRVLAEAAQTLDLTRPVAVLLLMTTQFLDGNQARAAVAELMRPLPPGSFLAMSALTEDHMPAEVAAAITTVFTDAGETFHLRSQAELAALLPGLRRMEPGITPLAEWRADAEPQPRPSPTEVSAYAALAFKDLADTCPRPATPGPGSSTDPAPPDSPEAAHLVRDAREPAA